jgi:endonuclease/exonuclease/phosphatase family metal-dependent hydrolase
MIMRVATWNLSHAVKKGRRTRERAWEHLGAMAPDVALVQEAGTHGVPSSVIRGRDRERRDWVTAVVSYGAPLAQFTREVRPSWNRKLSFTMPDIARDGTVAIAEATFTKSKPVIFISLYGMLRYADQSVLRVATDLIPLFDSPLGKRVILGGDLNIHTHSGSPSELRRAKPILALLESIGLHDLVRTAATRGVLRQGTQASAKPCPCAQPDCTHVRTHRHASQPPGTMANNDYLFATEELARSLSDLVVMNGDDDPAWKHSDHAPLIATFGGTPVGPSK